jgi:hypothetical protein
MRRIFGLTPRKSKTLQNVSQINNYFLFHIGCSQSKNEGTVPCHDIITMVGLYGWIFASCSAIQSTWSTHRVLVVHGPIRFRHCTRRWSQACSRRCRSWVSLFLCFLSCLLDRFYDIRTRNLTIPFYLPGASGTLLLSAIHTLARQPW